MIKADSVTKIFGLTPRQASKAMDRDRSGAVNQAADSSVWAVDNVSFSVEPGSVFVIMGLSGSGKSTLIRMVNGLIPPTSGDIYFGDINLTKADPARLREIRNHKISMVFQHFALFPHKSILDNAAFGLKIRGLGKPERRGVAKKILDQVGLGARVHSYPHELSGGMQQRVGLARALATDPDVLLMDEPFSALDPLIRRQMQSLLLDLQRDFRKTILFVTHDLNEAIRIGDHIMIMREGRVVQLGSAADIILRPADDYIRGFVADIDPTDLLAADAIMHPAGCTIKTFVEPTKALQVLNEAGEAACYVLDDRSRIVGLVQREALEEAVANRAEDVGVCLTSQYPVAQTDTPLRELCRMAAGSALPIAVVDAEDALAGVVTPAAILSVIGSGWTEAVEGMEGK